MIVCYRYSDEYPVTIGIPLEQWYADMEPRIYVVLPKESERICEVDIIYPPMEWCLLKGDEEDFEFDSKELLAKDELKLTKQVSEDLYYVWDDGASAHPERAARIFSYFEQLIKAYKNDALRIRQIVLDWEYERKLEEAKEYGYDTSLIVKPKADIAFGRA